MSELNPSTESELPPGTFAPQSPLLEEVLTPIVKNMESSAELELFAQIIGDRLSLRLSPEMERHGFHQSNHIFAPRAIAHHQTIALSFAQEPNGLERLAQEIEQLLHHRLIHERERWGRSSGCLPW